jgi:hypothetical protein
MIEAWSSKKWVLPNAKTPMYCLDEQGNQNEPQFCPLRLPPDAPRRRTG